MEPDEGITTEVTFPREIDMGSRGIVYKEEGPNTIYVNLVEKNGSISLVFTIDQSDIGAEFSAMAFGRVVYTVPLVQALQLVEESSRSD